MKGDFSKQLETPVMGVDEDQPQRQYVELTAVRAHAALLFLIVIATLGAMLAVLPAVNSIPGTGQTAAALPEVRVFLFAIVSGAAGAAVHALTAFAAFAGNRQLTRSWLPWIYLRIPIGALLAALVYFGIRAGVFSAGELKTSKDVFIVAFLCSLSGMFSKQVTDKLSDLIDNLLTPQKKPVREDPLKSGVPDANQALRVEEQQTVPEETVQKAQQRLIELGYLPLTAADGKPADDGVLGPVTGSAIEDFLSAAGIVGEARDATLGQESDPDFWPNLLELLEQAVNIK